MCLQHSACELPNCSWTQHLRQLLNPSRPLQPSTTWISVLCPGSRALQAPISTLPLPAGDWPAVQDLPGPGDA